MGGGKACLKEIIKVREWRRTEKSSRATIARLPIIDRQKSAHVLMWSRKNRLKKLLRLEKGREKFKGNVTRLANKTF